MRQSRRVRLQLVCVRFSGCVVQRMEMTGDEMRLWFAFMRQDGKMTALTLQALFIQFI